MVRLPGLGGVFRELLDARVVSCRAPTNPQRAFERERTFASKAAYTLVRSSPFRSPLSSMSTSKLLCSSVYLARFVKFLGRGESLSSELEEEEEEGEGSRGRFALDELGTGAACFCALALVAFSRLRIM